MDKAATIKALQQQLDDAREQLKQQSEDELAALEPVFVWSISWKSEHVLYVSKWLSDQSIEQFDLWRKKYASVGLFGTTGLSWSGPWVRRDETSGMYYLLIDNYLAHCGSGTHVLKSTPDGKDTFSHEPRKLTDAEAQSLRGGVVPESLKR